MGKKKQTFCRTLIKAASFTEESLRLSLRQWISPLEIYEKQLLTFALVSTVSKYDLGGSKRHEFLYEFRAVNCFTRNCSQIKAG